MPRFVFIVALAAATLFAPVAAGIEPE